MKRENDKLERQRGVSETPVILFKADDFCSIFPRWRTLLGSVKRRDFAETSHLLRSDDTVSLGWRGFLDCIIARDLKASLGIIGCRARTDGFFSLVTSLHNTGRFEFFNHGWDHSRDEFKDTTYSIQRRHMRKTQDLVKAKTGITLRGFGAPGNSIDQTTSRVVEDDSEIKYWYFGHLDCKKYVFRRFADLESPTAVPNYDVFVNSYSPDHAYLVYQLHPKNWTRRMLDEFLRTVDFLQEKKASFILPSEHHLARSDSMSEL